MYDVKDSLQEHINFVVLCPQLILQGDIHFHLGMLLLSASNVQVLGGQVDHLVEMNRQNRVLARLL